MLCVNTFSSSGVRLIAGAGFVCYHPIRAEPVSCPRNSMYFVAIKMGRRQGGPSRTGGGSGAYLNRYVTDEQRSRRPIFIATLWAGAGWLFFCVARSARMIQIGALRSRLEKQPTDSRQNRCYFGDRTLARNVRVDSYSA